uniref:Uncharacterized protein n=1 Tax=viral metagenome TaxID=1070528 RepID=A0A6C0E0I1_9ZZZZ
MTIKKEILYPMFLECFQFTTDSFWENVFEDLAYGKTPYGTYINKNFLCCNYKNKEFSYKIEKKDPLLLYNDVYNLLVKKLGLLSVRDKLNKKIDFNNIEEDLKNTRKNWNNIRKKNIKDLLIENYVINMKNKYNLNVSQSRKLISTIFIGLIFKVFSVKDINYDDGVITSIDGITFEDNKVILERDIYDIENDYRKCILIDKQLISDNWEKYLNNLQKLL